MAITSFEARVRHRYRLYGIGSLLAIGGVRHHALILLKRIPLRREGVGEKNFFLAVAR
jgi:hypothetical protein